MYNAILDAIRELSGDYGDRESELAKLVSDYGDKRFNDGFKLAKDQANCKLCIEGHLSSHIGSSFCECGSIASGGDKAHCTCDRCF